MDTEQQPVRAGEGRVSPTVAYERSDVSASRLATGAGLFLAGVVLVTVFVAVPFFMFKSHRAEVSPPRSPEAPAGWRVPPNPRLQESPEVDLQGYLAGYDKALASYSWVDKQRGIAVIPIERALQIAARRGLPRVPPGPQIPLSQPAEGDRLTGLQDKVVAPPQ
ncbi:MAG: hypothetical protein M3Z09_07025 [Acidobacteriota bacterium]|nr:hypothetical protein [Acidobacteriota bacterium]